MFKQKFARKWGHATAREWATLLLDRLRNFVVAPSSVGLWVGTLLLCKVLRVWTSEPLWTITTTTRVRVRVVMRSTPGVKHGEQVAQDKQVASGGGGAATLNTPNTPRAVYRGILPWSTLTL